MAVGYMGEFLTEDYIATRFNAPGGSVICEFLLEQLNGFVSSRKLKPNSLKILDYGCGPSMVYEIGIAPIARELVLAEFDKSHRAFLQKWLDKDPSGHDWSPYFRHVVETIEKGSNEETVRRENEVRRKIKALVPCNILQNQFIAEGYEGAYDIVMSFLCLDGGCMTDTKTYEVGIKRLTSLVKEDGLFLLLSTHTEHSDTTFFKIGARMLRFISLKKDFVIKLLERYFIIEHCACLPNTSRECANNDGYLFIVARKKVAANN